MKIKIKLLNPKCTPEQKGNWIDLKAAETVKFNAPKATTLKRKRDGSTPDYRKVEFDNKRIPLGVAIQLPKGYEAIVMPRSGTFGVYKIMQTNSQGLIDETYCGDNDQWKMPCIAFNATTVNEGDRICQFRIQLSQDATFWQKIKWLFNSKIEFEYVECLNNPDRGGFNSTGVK